MLPEHHEAKLREYDLPDEISAVAKFLSDNELWHRRASFCLAYLELLFPDERRFLAKLLFDLAPSPLELNALDALFQRQTRFVLGEML